MKKIYMDFYNKANKEDYKDKNIILVKPDGFNKENDTEEVRQYLIDIAVFDCLNKKIIKEDEDYDIVCLN